MTRAHDSPTRGPTRLIVSLTRREPPLEQQVRDALAAGADAIELRVDLIDDIPAVERVLAARPCELILTVRSRDEGGAFDGSEAERISLIERLGLFEPGWIDVELSAWRRSANLRQKVRLVAGPPDAGGRPRNRLILSHHDLRATPDDPARVLEQLAGERPDAVKAAFTARDARDALRVLAALRASAARIATIAIAMGPAGVCTRILAKKLGAFASFATLQIDHAAAPGQLTIGQMRTLYRWDAIGPRTRTYGLVGWPIEHSFSPLLHNAAMAESGIDGVYVPLPVEPAQEAFDGFMQALESAPWLDPGGLSVTIPHKPHAWRWLRDRGAPTEPDADAAAAVNTLTHQQAGTWYGDNTDIRGLSDALRRCEPYAEGRYRRTRADVLGAGGVAAAAVAALRSLGHRVTVFSRSRERARSLCERFECDWRPWDERERSDAAIVVHCTPLGMWPTTDVCPLGQRRLRPGTLVVETVYNPLRTRLIELARRRGCDTIDGLELFIAQAAGQFRRWHGRRPDDTTLDRWRRMCEARLS